MKTIISALLFVSLSIGAYSQGSYVSAKGFYYPTLPTNAFGGTVAAGFHKGVASAGLGVGVIIVDPSSDPYVPIFAEVNIIPMKTKLSPYIGFQIGYGLYKGTADFIEEKNRYVKGGFYSTMMGGVAYGKKTKGILFAAVTPFMLTDKLLRNPNTYNKAVFSVGVSFLAFN